MTDDARSLAAVRSSHDRFAGLVEGLSGSEVTGPSYDDDWTIADVASHLGSQAEIFAGALEAGVAGRPAPGNDTFPPIWDRWNARPPADQVRDSVARNEELVTRLEHLSADERSAFRVSLFGMEQDLAEFAVMRLSEHAVHTWDVAVALDPTATIAPDSVDLLVDLLPLRAGRVGKPVPDAPPLVVETSSPQRRLRLQLEPEVALVPDSDNAEPDLRLPAEALIRLVYGRLDPSHTPDGISGDEHLDVLRKAFPGF